MRDGTTARAAAEAVGATSPSGPDRRARSLALLLAPPTSMPRPCWSSPPTTSSSSASAPTREARLPDPALPFQRLAQVRTLVQPGMFAQPVVRRLHVRCADASSRRLNRATRSTTTMPSRTGAAPQPPQPDLVIWLQVWVDDAKSASDGAASTGAALSPSTDAAACRRERRVFAVTTVPVLAVTASVSTRRRRWRPAFAPLIEFIRENRLMARRARPRGRCAHRGLRLVIHRAPSVATALSQPGLHRAAVRADSGGPMISVWLLLPREGNFSNFQSARQPYRRSRSRLHRRWSTHYADFTVCASSTPPRSATPSADRPRPPTSTGCCTRPSSRRSTAKADPRPDQHDGRRLDLMQDATENAGRTTCTASPRRSCA